MSIFSKDIPSQFSLGAQSLEKNSGMC